MSKPGSDPLGAKPMLPPPTGDAAERASKAFREYVDDARRAPRAPQRRPPAARPSESLPEADGFGDGRRYDLALSMVSGQSPASFEPDAMAEPDPGSSDSSDAETQVMQAPGRPPPGAPTVRPPIARATPETVPQELLETTADSAMLSANPDGSTSFEIAFNDDVFRDLACRITVIDGKVIATFQVTDDNTRRLLEAESRALVARLEDRGLKVQEVRVEMAER